MLGILTEDFKDFIRLLQGYGVEFLICGGHAVSFHGYPRLTMDFDILINPTTENADKMMKVLTDFGFGDVGISKELFLREGTAITMGVQPNQIDLLTSVGACVETVNVFENAVPGRLEQFDVLYISKADLIAAKRAAGRAKDLADVEELLKIDV